MFESYMAEMTFVTLLNWYTKTCPFGYLDKLSINIQIILYNSNNSLFNHYHISLECGQ
jgi:hypothetical protein